MNGNTQNVFSLFYKKSDHWKRVTRTVKHLNCFVKVHITRCSYQNCFALSATLTGLSGMAEPRGLLWVKIRCLIDRTHCFAVNETLFLAFHKKYSTFSLLFAWRHVFSLYTRWLPVYLCLPVHACLQSVGGSKRIKSFSKL